MKRFLLQVLVVFVILPATLALAQSSEDTLVRSLGGDVRTLNPALISDTASASVSRFLWDGLFEADPETGEPLPKLATWKISDDGLSYTFKISDKAFWNDGTPITSADVKFTYDAILNDSVPSPFKANFSLIKSLTVIDDKSFTVALKAVDCTIWGSAFASLFPMPAHIYAPDFSDFVSSKANLEPKVTSGPYYVDQANPGEFVHLHANATYWGGAPKIPFILNRVVADTAVQNQELLSGSVDYAFMYPDQLEQLGSASNLNAFVKPLNNTPLLILNWADPAHAQAAYDENHNPIKQAPNKFFSDVRVRQAIAMGYDKASVVKTLGPNGGFLLNGPFVPMFAWAQAPGVGPYPYDPERAALLLDEAGWLINPSTGIREKNGVPFSFDLVYSPLVDLWTTIALVAQDQLGQLGIQVNVKSMEWNAFVDNVALPQTYDATVIGFSGGTQVDGVAYDILYSKNDVPGSGLNIGSYVNPKVDALLAQGRSTVGCSQEDRAGAYQELNRIVMDDVAYDFTVGTNQVLVMNKRIQNYAPGAFNEFWHIPEWSIGTH